MVTIKIRENSKQAKLFLEYVKSLSFVEFLEDSSKTTKKKEKLLNDIKNGLKEVKNIREGKSKPLTTNDLWNE